MVRIGIVGVGFMGMIHYLAAQRLRGAKVAAIHTRDPKKLAGDWTGIRGNFGPTGTKMDLSRVKGYAKFEALLADDNIDLIDICTPTYLHEEMALAALAAGKHVLVEKAFALEIKQADAMVKAAARAGKLLMVAHVLPFFPEFAFAHEAIRGGDHGQLLGGYFKRVISKPDWSADIGDASKLRRSLLASSSAGPDNVPCLESEKTYNFPRVRTSFFPVLPCNFSTVSQEPCHRPPVLTRFTSEKSSISCRSRGFLALLRTARPRGLSPTNCAEVSVPRSSLGILAMSALASSNKHVS